MMAKSSPVSNTYRMGYSDSITKFQVARGAESEAFALLPFLKPTDKLLDLGCGPGSITIGLAPQVASVTAIDLSGISIDMTRKRIEDMKTAGTLEVDDAAKINCLQADVLAGLPFPDNAFDVVYASQIFVHLTGPGQAASAMTEVRRVLRPGGILATRDAAEALYYPRHLNMWDNWGKKMNRALLGHDTRFVADGKPVSPDVMPRLYRESGFDPSKTRISLGLPWLFAGRAGREFCLDNWIQKLDDPSLLDKWDAAGITDEDKESIKKVLAEWLENDDAYLMVTHCDILGWK